MTATLSVFCGSRPGRDSRFAAAAAAVGRGAAERGIAVACGAGAVGLMTEVVGAALAAGGAVRGVLAADVDETGADPRLTDVIAVRSEQDRLHALLGLGDALVALPGGLGTIAEAAAAAAAVAAEPGRRLVLLDVAGYWQPFASLLRGAAAHGFVDQFQTDGVVVTDRVDAVFDLVLDTQTRADRARADRMVRQ